MRVTRASAALAYPNLSVNLPLQAHKGVIGAGISSESGFSGFVRLVFNPQAFIRVRLGGISDYGENRKPGEVKF